MSLAAEDRVGLILGRAVMRAEALQAQLEHAQKRIAELEAQAAAQDNGTRVTAHD